MIILFVMLFALFLWDEITFQVFLWDKNWIQNHKFSIVRHHDAPSIIDLKIITHILLIKKVNHHFFSHFLIAQVFHQAQQVMPPVLVLGQSLVSDC